MKKQITRISLRSCVKLSAVYGAFCGLLQALISSAFMAFTDGSILMIALAFPMTIIAGVIVSVVGCALMVLLYNFLASYLGGVEFRVVTRE